MEGGSVWQSGRRRGVVLRAVFVWLGAADLARAGAACRSWRRAAADDSLWRHLLLQQGAEAKLLRRQRHGQGSRSWRQEYVDTCTPWRRVARLASASAVQHAALAPSGRLLALVEADASVSVWERGEAWTEWRAAGGVALRARGWASAARAAWSQAGALLVAGPLALAPRWELLVLRRGAGAWHVAARARCSPGAAGCWADAAGAAFLSLELRRVAPRLAVTAVHLNSASQETHSEYAGVTVPLMLIFAEDGAHVAHAFVTDGSDPETGPDIAAVDPPPHVPDADDGWALGGSTSRRVLVASGGTWVGLWELGAAALPPPVLAGAPGELAARVRRRRESRASPSPVEPDEAAVRAACTPPARRLRLAAALEGLVATPGGRWAWALTSDGAATCVSLPGLCALRELGPPTRPAPAPVHYVQAGVTKALLARPGGAYSCYVQLWGVRSGARGAALRHDAPALCALLAGGERGEGGGDEGDGLDDSDKENTPVLLVVAGDALHVWQHRASLQSPPE